MTWEAVIGVEIHVQLKTGRKLFCGNRPVFGDPPNTHICPVCLGLPGALPVLDHSAVDLAVRTSLALGCEVHHESVWARKNYFYPDLPKGYQITQFDRPIATNGSFTFEGPDGDVAVRIRRVHMEEDAGKSLHDRIAGATAVDLNRAGTPLVEIVTEPDLRDPADTRAFLTALKHVLEYLDVSDCNMEEGSLRADANVSLRAVGSTALGTKTEIKNVNSFSGIERALVLEIARQTDRLEAGDRVSQATLSWDDHRGELRLMRSKEESHDYRYFPEPDLPPLHVTEDQIVSARAALPELPRARKARFETTHHLPAYDSGVLTQTSATADYFEALVKATSDPKAASNWIMGPLSALMNQRGEDALSVSVRPAALAELIELVADGTLSESAAKKLLLHLAEEGGSPRESAEARGLVQIRDADQLSRWVESALAELGDEVHRYRAGETKLLGPMVGRVMQISGGAADPRMVRQLLVERLEA